VLEWEWLACQRRILKVEEEDRWFLNDMLPDTRRARTPIKRVTS